MSLKDNKCNKDNNIEFKQWLLNIGDGVFKTKFKRNNDVINISNEISSNGDIITEIFGDIIKSTDTEFQQSLILAPKNLDVWELNSKILCRKQTVR